LANLECCNRGLKSFYKCKTPISRLMCFGPALVAWTICGCTFQITGNVNSLLNCFASQAVNLIWYCDYQGLKNVYAISNFLIKKFIFHSKAFDERIPFLGSLHHSLTVLSLNYFKAAVLIYACDFQYLKW